MKQVTDESRRSLLKRVTLGVVLVPVTGLGLRAAIAGDLPLLTADDPAAKGLKYVSDASKASGAKPGSTCANCSNSGSRWVRPGWLPPVPWQGG
jgi:High potential iron-sulfur protein